MDQIAGQLGQLFLAAVPTVIIVFLFYFFLKWSFFGPIERVTYKICGVDPVARDGPVTHPGNGAAR